MRTNFGASHRATTSAPWEEKWIPAQQLVPVIDAMPFEQTLVPVDPAGEARRLEVRRGQDHDARTRGLEDGERAVELAGQELGEQQACDQEAAEDEEGVDTEVLATRPADVGVVEED